MPDLRPILFVIGLLLVPLGLGMLVPVVVDLAASNPDWQAFLATALLTMFFGAGLAVATRSSEDQLSPKQAFFLTTAVWFILPAFAALPFVMSELDMSYTDAYFEAMSGLTTTGSTVISGLDITPPGILIWRAILQWLGGVGIIVMAIAVLPMLRIGGMQLFRMESSDTSEKILPRAAQISGAVAGLYLVFTTICFFALVAAGLAPFDAIAHAMTTIATGGFSTSDGSVGHFDNAAVDAIIICFMIIGSLPFVLYLQALRGRPMALWRDGQVQTFAALVTFVVIAVSIWLVVYKGFEPGAAIRFGSFNIISIMTGTGFSTTDYGAWGAFAVAMFFFVMFIGGCAGSTTCGIKIFRFQVLAKSIAVHLKKVNRPHGVFAATFNGRQIPQSVISSVTTYFLLFIVSFFVLAAALTMTGVDFITAFSGAGTALSNVGPGLGSTIGPAGTFEPLPDGAKWLLSLGMLMGRLELLTVLVLFSPAFWRS